MQEGDVVVHIARTPDEIWPRLVDLENAPEWVPDLVSARRLTDGEVGVGTRYAEVVSIFEYELATKIGVSPSRIIFNGPYKSETDLLHALEAGSIVNVDSYNEVLAIERIARARPELPTLLGG